MALFGKKNNDGHAPAGPATGDVYMPEPDKAESFFKHARTVGQTGNHEYATTLWLQGIRMDPSSMSGLESFHQAAMLFARERGKAGPTKDQANNFGDKKFHRGVERYLLTLLDFGTRPGNLAAAVKAMNAAGAIDQAEATFWIGERALAAARKDPKVKKDHLLKIKEAAEKVGAFDMAVKAGEYALSLDRSDIKLADELRNLSAQATMTAGGYTETGEGGGFRSSVRDTGAAQALDEEGRLVKSEDVAQRVLAAAREDYESRKTDRHAITRYVRALIEAEIDENERIALGVLELAYEQTQEYQFRRDLGRLEIRRAKRAERAAKAGLESNPEDSTLQANLREAHEARQNIEFSVFEAQIEAYPTDLALKFELGKLYHLAGKDKEAIALLQQAVKDARHRINALDYLGRSFNRIGWVDESISVLRQAIEAEESSGVHVSLDRQYALMTALVAKAQGESDLEAAEEAGQLASTIAMEQIDFQDILEFRQTILELLKTIKAGA